MENFEKYVTDVTTVISSNNEKIIQLHKEIARLQKEMETITLENQHFLKQLMEATKDKASIKVSAITPTTKPMTFSSKLVTMPSSSISISTNLSNLSMSDKLKYTPETLKAYDQITKYYDYKSNPDTCRLSKSTKYPRYICYENAKPETVYNLFMYGFVDKILTDEDMYSISKLPSSIIRSMEAMIKEMGTGSYGIQIFDASTDLVGKPIILCQLFKTGKNTEIMGDTQSLKIPFPCDIGKFQEWLCEKRAIGLSTLRSKIRDMIRAGKAVVISESHGGGITEHIITLYYDYSITHSGTAALEIMLDKIENLKYNHAKHTIECYQRMTGPRKRPLISLKNNTDNTNEKGNSDPFA